MKFFCLLLGIIWIVALCKPSFGQINRFPIPPSEGSQNFGNVPFGPPQIAPTGGQTAFPPGIDPRTFYNRFYNAVPPYFPPSFPQQPPLQSSQMDTKRETKEMKSSLLDISINLSPDYKLNVTQMANRIQISIFKDPSAEERLKLKAPMEQQKADELANPLLNLSG